MRDGFGHAPPVATFHGKKCVLPSVENLPSMGLDVRRNSFVGLFTRYWHAEAILRKGVVSHVRSPKDIPCGKSERKTYVNFHGSHY